MSTSKEFGKKFLQKREELGYSVEEVGTQTRIHCAVIRDIEAGIFDRLNKLYMKSFIEKYSKFLGMNVEKILDEYRGLSESTPEKDFTLRVKEKEEKAKPEIKINIDEKTMRKIAIGIGAVLALYILFSLVGMIKNKIVEANKNRPVKKIVKMETPKKAVIKETVPVKEIKVEPVKEIVAEPVKEKIVPPVKSDKTVLMLKATGEVWVHVTDEKGKVLYSGILNRGDKKTIDAKGTINVWTGKAEELEFVVNSEVLGKIASGVIKDIKISSEKITIDEETIVKLQ